MEWPTGTVDYLSEETLSTALHLTFSAAVDASAEPTKTVFAKPLAAASTALVRRFRGVIGAVGRHSHSRLFRIIREISPPRCDAMPVPG
jgi:hypothetical protein